MVQHDISSVEARRKAKTVKFVSNNVCQESWNTSCDLCCRRATNPLPCTTMLFEGDRNTTGGRNGVFPNT